MKILHIADLHLGAKLSGFNPDGIKFIKSQIDKALAKLQDMLTSEQYDGIVLVGDIFDSPQVSPYYIKKLERIFKLALDRGAFVVYATGNHDYFISEKHFSSLLSYDKFILFTEDKILRQVITHHNQKLAFYGIGYHTYHPQENLNSKFPPRQDEDIAIGLLHGDVNEGNSIVKSDYYSASAVDLANKNYDYFALGHIHSFTDFTSNVLYPGCPYAQGLDEAGDKFVLAVDITNGITSYQQIKIANYQVYDLNFACQALDRFELASKLRNFIEDKLASAVQDSLLRIKGKITGFNDYLSNDDIEFREQVFGHQSANNHILELSYQRTAKELDFNLPIELEEAIQEAIEELSGSDMTSYELSGLDCNQTVTELIQAENFKTLLLELMGQNYEN